MLTAQVQSLEQKIRLFTDKHQEELDQKTNEISELKVLLESLTETKQAPTSSEADAYAKAKEETEADHKAAIEALEK